MLYGFIIGVPPEAAFEAGDKFKTGKPFEYRKGEAGKIIDEQEVADARRFRDALDALKGTSEELTVQVGGKLVPVVADLAEELTIVYNAAQRLGGLIPEQVTTPIGLLTDQVKRSFMPWKYYTDFAGLAAETTGTLGDITGNYSGVLDESTDVVEGNTEALRDRVAAMEASEAAERGAQSASLAYRQQVADTTAAVQEATLKQLDATLTDQERAQAARDAEAAVALPVSCPGKPCMAAPRSKTAMSWFLLSSASGCQNSAVPA
jgi:hypothetical protein